MAASRGGGAGRRPPLGLRRRTGVKNPFQALTVAFALGLMGCSFSEGEPVCSRVQRIIEGESGDDAGIPPAVQSAIGAFAVYDDPNWPEPTGLCTVTRVAENWAITAAHCWDSGERSGYFSPSTHVVLTFEPVLTRDGANCGRDPVALSATRWRKHPSLDLMLIRFALPESVEAPAVLAPSSFSPESSVGILAGYGEREDGSSGERRFIEASMVSWSSEVVTVDAEAKGGACLGDSGGPLLILEGDEYRVVGVLSGGSADCRGQDRYTRVDGPEVQSWIDQAIESFARR